MVYELVPSEHPALKKELEEFDFSNPPVDPIQLANGLIETMIAEKGLGLSANQCGLEHRVFVMHSSPTKVCFNPRVVTASNEDILLDEGCLTFPNLFVKIKRPQRIKVRYQDVTGDTHTEVFTGMTARIFLHELDHLNGKVFTQRANVAHLQRALREQKQLNRQKKLFEKVQHAKNQGV